MPLTDLTLPELLAFRPEVEEPADFDAFWTDTIAEARSVAGTAATLVPASTPVTQLIVEDLTFPGFGGEPVRAWVSRPREAAGALPAGAFHHTSDLLNTKLGDRQVLAAMSANEPILDWKITGPGQRATLSAVLTDGMKAVSIRVNDVAGVAGFVLPGDRVDVMLSRTQDNQAFVDVLLQNIKVLAVDQIADDKKDNPTVAKSVTVEVSTVDAQKLTLAASVGQLSLALREVAANTDEATQRVSLSDLSGTTLAAPKPATSAPVLPAPVIVKPTTAAVDVYRGTQLQTYEVPLSN